jgi:hypothetical protein
MQALLYSRIRLSDGEVVTLRFAEIDGGRFKEQFRCGYSPETALLIVNRWNYISAMVNAGAPQYFYWVPSVEGAA